MKMEFTFKELNNRGLSKTINVFVEDIQIGYILKYEEKYKAVFDLPKYESHDYPASLEFTFRDDAETYLKNKLREFVIKLI